jgi:hypothetical protein
LFENLNEVDKCFSADFDYKTVSSFLIEQQSNNFQESLKTLPRLDNKDKSFTDLSS